MAVSVLFRIDRNGHIGEVDDGPVQLRPLTRTGSYTLESAVITHAGEDLGGDLWRWLS